MRLICPNCDAQYDIADDVIPEGGRDVQCSSCAHTWYQTDKPKVAGRLTPQTAAAEDTPTVPPQIAPRKPLDSSIADILREEAAREHEVPSTQEAQPHPSEKTDQSQEERAEETRKRIAQMAEEEGATPAAVAAAATGAVAGTNLRTVPGIDEINATLRARAEASDTSGLTEDEKQEVVKRRGFRRGFFVVLLLLVILITPYFFASEITENLPQTQSFMTTYVETVDQARLWLNDQVQTLQGMVNDAMGSSDAVPETTTTDPLTTEPAPTEPATDG